MTFAHVNVFLLTSQYATSALSGDVGAGISREDYIDKVANDVLVKLPEEFNMDKIRKKFGIEISPTTVVLLQELDRFNLLINKMRKSLITLRKVSQYTLVTGYGLACLLSLQVKNYHVHRN